MKRVAIYIRSALKDKSGKIERQSEQLQKYAFENGGTVVGIYVDNGRSGCRMFGRRSLKKMLRQCKKGEVDEVLILTQSHLARKVKIYRKVCDKLKKYGVSLTATDRQNIDESTENMLLYLATKTKGFA